MKATVITFTLFLLCGATSFAAGDAARVAGDLKLNDSGKNLFVFKSVS